MPWLSCAIAYTSVMGCADLHGQKGEVRLCSIFDADQKDDSSSQVFQNQMHQVVIIDDVALH